MAEDVELARRQRAGLGDAGAGLTGIGKLVEELAEALGVQPDALGGGPKRSGETASPCA